MSNLVRPITHDLSIIQNLASDTRITASQHAPETYIGQSRTGNSDAAYLKLPIIFQTCTALQVNLFSLTAVPLADILTTMSLSSPTSHSSCLCSSVIKALRRLVKAADVRYLRSFYSNLFGSFLRQKTGTAASSSGTCALGASSSYGELHSDRNSILGSS